jgi:ABC-type Fe3+/spermidine/putrescine transport system ATPase subunit
MSEAAATLRLERVRKQYGAATVVEELSLTVRPGEFFTLLGPSGCGKTTTLRIVAGLEHPDGGRVDFGSEAWADAAERRFMGPQQRRIGMVFQSYALWPHMTVYENVAYPLKVRRQPLRRVDEMLEMVGLGAYRDRSAARLSGGQQQRVALARALVCEPRLLLLDEPFSNLDVHLRQSLRTELRSIQRRLGLTVLLVTHDQLDAFVLSDRIGVMRAGRFEQVGDAREIYERPVSPYVRDFVGHTVLFPARLRSHDESGMAAQLPSGEVVVLPCDPMASAPVRDGALMVSVRPEDLRLDGAGIVLLEGIVESLAYMGDHIECTVVDRNGVSVRVPDRSGSNIAVGRTVRLLAEPRSLRAWHHDAPAAA